MTSTLTTEPSEREPEEGIALCLSGGGYRAMLFHLGSLWRLNEMGILSRLNRISSVSGGSITAATLGLHWHELAFDGQGIAANFDLVTRQIRNLAGKTIDIASALSGLLIPGRTISDAVASAYDRHLFHGATLQNLPADDAGPRFVINATNLQSGALWRFSRPYMRDYLVGSVSNPRVSLADAVAASSAFPPFLSPFTLKVDPAAYDPPAGEPLHRPPFTTRVVLSDGGVYDNLGIETAWKRYKTILVSNGGGKMGDDPKPPSNWVMQSKRVLDVIDNQVRSLRARQVVESLEGPPKIREGAYWAIRGDIDDYDAPGRLPCPLAETLELAATPTRLAALPKTTQERLINWGYAIADAAIRRFYRRDLAPPAAFPYPGGVG